MEIVIYSPSEFIVILTLLVDCLLVARLLHLAPREPAGADRCSIAVTSLVPDAQQSKAKPVGPTGVCIRQAQTPNSARSRQMQSHRGTDNPLEIGAGQENDCSHF